ncbi:MAG: alpha/beta hydrolase [Pseudomonadales bacterium]|nr:alpha/beta hydrolase [Pseudomonadales bacterium]
MPLHPEFEAMLAQIAEAGRPGFNEMSPTEARDFYSAMRVPADHILVHEIEDRTISSAGGDIPIRIYTPEGSGPFPVFMNFHGGGWVIGDLESADAQCRQICSLADCIVVSVDYRLAPEHVFPAAADDCYTATCWVAEHAESLNADAKRIAIGGDSAGGNLAAVVALKARDENGPELVFQLLVYPVTDARCDSQSYSDNADGYMLTRDSMLWFWDHYCPATMQRSHAYASPALATDLSNLPPAFVLTAEYDPLRDEGEAYAVLLEKAGVEVDCKRYPGLIHGFFSLCHVLTAGQDGMQDACNALKKAFS